MYARLLLASVCLLRVGALAAPSVGIEASPKIEVYFRQVADLSSVAFNAMQRETGALMELSGFRVQWPDEPNEVTADFLVVVEFEGSCNPWPNRAAQPFVQRLASTSVANGRILPFIRVDCNSLRQFLAPALRGKLRPNPQFLYGRAMGRLLAHELYHFVGQTPDHASVGLTRAAVSMSDLISDQFTFAEDALSKLHQPPTSSTVEVDIGADSDLQ